MKERLQKLTFFAAYVGIAVIGINLLNIDVTIVHQIPKPLQIQTPYIIKLDVSTPTNFTITNMDYKYR